MWNQNQQLFCICDGWADVPGAFFNWLLIFSPPSVTLKRAYVCLCICTGVSNENKENCVCQTVLLVCLCRRSMTQQRWRSGCAVTLKFNTRSQWSDLSLVVQPHGPPVQFVFPRTCSVWVVDVRRLLFGSCMMNAIDRDVVSRHRPACSHNDPSQFH